MKAGIMTGDITYIISVSCGKGCYRHLLVPGQYTLEELADTILDAFDFDNDRLYSFFMDDRWQSAAVYCSPGEDTGNSADSVRLFQLGLQKGQGFKFRFDPGNEQRFQCRVLQVYDQKAYMAEVIRKKGEAPARYPRSDEDKAGMTDTGRPAAAAATEPEKVIPLIENEKFSVPEAAEFCISDALLEAAFRFRSEKLWKKLYDAEMFAVRLSDGETGYCCISGFLGEFYALILYIGDIGIWSYEQSKCNLPPLDALVTQNCLQLTLENKADVPPEVYAALCAYAQMHGISFRGGHSYPNFLKMESYFVPKVICAENDHQYLLEALQAAHAVSEKLKHTAKEKLGFSGKEGSLPLLIPENGGFRWEVIPFPEIKPYPYPRPVIAPECVEAVKALPQKGKLECGILLNCDTEFFASDSPAYFQAALLIAGSPAAMKDKLDAPGDYPASVNILMRQFTDKMLKAGVRPQEIRTNGKAAYAFLEPLCRQCGIPLVFTKEKLPKLEAMMQQSRPPMPAEAAEALTKEFMPLIALMEQMDEDMLRQMPDSIREFARQVYGTGIFSAKLEKKLKKIL